MFGWPEAAVRPVRSGRSGPSAALNRDRTVWGWTAADRVLEYLSICPTQTHWGVFSLTDFCLRRLRFSSFNFFFSLKRWTCDQTSAALSFVFQADWASVWLTCCFSWCFFILLSTKVKTFITNTIESSLRPGSRCEAVRWQKVSCSLPQQKNQQALRKNRWNSLT